MLSREVVEKYDTPLTTIGAIGFSAMMHGYLAFDRDGNLLAPFRTWRNTTTGQAAEELTNLFGFNIPLRWSIAHLYQAILDKEPHVKDIRHLTTLAGYVHWRMTGQKVLGVGDASGMFPIDSRTNDYDARMIEQFNERLRARRHPVDARGHPAQGPGGRRRRGGPDRRGRTAARSHGTAASRDPALPARGRRRHRHGRDQRVAQRTGNVSAGTSVFAMIVLEKALSKVYPEIDMVTTPTGKPVAMVHNNNCTSDINAWVDLFGELADALEVGSVDRGCSRCCTTRRSRAMRTAAGSSPTIIFRVSRSRSWRKGARCSSEHPRAGSPLRTSCACTCSRRSLR